MMFKFNGFVYPLKIQIRPTYYYSAGELEHECQKSCIAFYKKKYN